MKRITFLMSLLLCLSGAMTAAAQATMPLASDGTTVYTYYIQCAGGHNDYFLGTSNVSEGGQVTFNTGGIANGSSSAQAVKLVANGDYYKLYTADDKFVIGCAGTDLGSYAKYYTANSTSATNTDWAVAEGNVTENTSSVNGYTPYFSICVGSTSYGWNTYGDAVSCALWYSYNNNSSWNFIPADLTTLQKVASDISSEISSELSSVTIPTGYKSSGQAAISALITKISATGYTYDIADALTALDIYSSFDASEYTIDLSDGYYYIESKATARYEHLFNDDFYESNTNKYTLMADSRVTTNNGVWKITVSGDTLTLVNGQGQSPSVVSGPSTNGEIKTSKLVVAPEATAQNDGYYCLANPGTNITINCPESGNTEVGNYRMLWTYYTENYTGSGNRWKFETATTSENVYTVAMTGVDDASGLYVTRTSTSEHAYNGGFFVSDTAPSESDFTASDATGYDYTISISGNTITVTYTPNTLGYYNLLQTAISEAQTVLDTRGVGYPTAQSAAYTTLESAITTAKTFTETTATAEAISNLETAVSTYKATTTDIQMPEDGKAYVFTNVHPGGGNKYINYEESALTLVDRGTDDANSLPMSAKFICRVLDDGRYAFANNDGVYLVWRGTSGSGYSSTYDSDYCPMTFVKMTTSSTNTSSATSNEDFFGMVAFGGKRDASYSSYFITNSDGTFNQDSGWTLRYTTSYSTAFLVEEVDYPNNVTLAEVTNIEGATNVGTFSAPFATVIPSGVSAYYAKENPTDEVLTLTEIEDAAIPANTGVVLASNSNETSALMVPATDEASTDVSADNKLGNSAGASKTIEDTDNAYVLALGSSEEPLYVKLHVNRNSANTNGCFFGFSELTLSNSNDESQYVTLTFNRSGYTLSDVTVTATTSNGTITATLEEIIDGSGNSLSLLQGSSTTYSTSVLCPNVNIGNGGSADITFKLEGLTASTFNNASLTTHAYQSTGNPQAGGGRYVDATISQGTATSSLTTFATFENINIDQSQSYARDGYTWSAEASSPITIAAVTTAAFYQAVVGTTLSMNKAYLILEDGTASAVALSFGNGQMTGVEEALAPAETVRKNVVYDLSGRRVQKATKGLYIVNGKKVCVK